MQAKRILSFLICLAMLLSSFSISAFAATDASLVTTIAHNMLGSESTLYANIVECSSGIRESTIAGGTIYMPAHSWAKFVVNSTETGLYFLQMKQAWAQATKIRVETDKNYYGELSLPANSSSFVNTNSSGSREYIYLEEGENTIVVINNSNNASDLFNCELKNTNLESTTLTMDQVKSFTTSVAPEAWATQSPTEAPTQTAAPDVSEWGWVDEVTADAAGTVTVVAPYAGVYLAQSDKAVTLTNETNHTVTLEANTPDYFYLIEGENKVTVSNAATVKFGGLTGNGMDYLSQVEHGSFHITTQNVTIDNVKLAAKATVSYDITVPQAGMYYFAYQWSMDANNFVFTFETDTGTYGKVKHVTYGWNHFGGETYVKYTYLREGTNTLKITNENNSTVTLNQVRISETTSYSGGLAWDKVNVILREAPVATPTPTATPTATPTPTPTPTPTVNPNYPDYVTVTDINLPGTGSTIGACLVGGSGASVDSSNMVTVANGGTALFTVPCTDAGIYKVQLKFSGAGKVRVEANDAYYQELTAATWTFVSADNAGVPAYIYLEEGDNTVIFYNKTGAAGTLSNLELKGTAYLWDAGTQFTMNDLKSIVPDATPTPTPTPIPTPDISDATQYQQIEAETASGFSSTTYNGKTVISVTDNSAPQYSITAEGDTIYQLHMIGAAWKDVSFDVLLDGVKVGHSIHEFQLKNKSETYVYNQAVVMDVPVTKGTHTLSFVFYCDTYYFDSFVLEDTSSKGYKMIHGFQHVTTSQEAYALLQLVGESAGIDVAADTNGIICPEMNFWSMVGKEYNTKEEAIEAYETAVSAPTVTVTNASGETVNSLPAGNSTVTVDCTNIPSGVSLITGVYQGNKLLGNVQVMTPVDGVATGTLSNVAAGSTLKIMTFSDIDSVKPQTSDGAYAHFYVAPNGKSANAGTSPDAPLGTLAQAFTKVKAINADMTGDIIIHVAPGVYRSNVTIAIDPAMGGKNGHKVIVRAEDMANKPILSGGEELTGKWKKVSGQNYWVASTSTRETRALYVNGYQATMARSSNEYSCSYIDPVSPKNDSHIADGVKVYLHMFPNFPKGLEGETRMQIVFNKGWANHRFPVESISYDSECAYVYTVYPYFNAFCNPSLHTETIMPVEGSAFYLENAMALLDQPGEFYFDKSARKMYYYPYANEDMTTAETYCAITDGLMEIVGSSSTNKVENLEFQGISFRYGAWDEVTTYGAAFNQADEMRRGTETHYETKLMHAQIGIAYADSVVFDQCEFACLGSNAIYMTVGVSNSKVVNSDFRDLSGGGISVGNFLHNSTYTNVERCSNIEIGNNIFRRCAQEFYGTTAVAVYYANGVNIHHNDIKNVGYTGISLGWGWGYAEPADCGNHSITYNKLTQCMEVLQDGAQVYTLGDQMNTHIMDNYFLDPGTYLAGGLYLDEASGYIQICDNVSQDVDRYDDYWLFARQHVDLNDNYCEYNYTDGDNPRYYYPFPLDAKGVAYGTNYIRQTSWNNIAQTIINEAGVTDKTRVTAVDYYPTWRTRRGIDIPID